MFLPPRDAWDRTVAASLAGVDEVVYRSHLVGSDPALTREGGGNFSAKGTAFDHMGRPTRVLWMSAWGCDGRTTTLADFPALRLDDLCALRGMGPLTETQMVEYILACGVRGEQPRPGIETLTHAFITAAHVDHTHPEALIALTSIPDGRERAWREFGDEAIWLDYRQFDVDLARELAERIAARPGCRFVLAANHGLFTWADTSEQCYRNSHEAVARATRALNAAIRRPADLGGAASPPMPAARAEAILRRALPVMRGALSSGGAGVVLHLDRSEEAVAFSASQRGPELSQRGPACPDHLATVGYRPLVLERIEHADEAPGAVLAGIERHREWYRGYYERGVTPAGRALGRGNDAPRAVLLPGIGVVAAGADAAKARLCADHFNQTMTVARAADAAGGYVTLSEPQGAADEYWPLLRLKPQLRPPGGPLAGRVLLLAGDDDDLIGDLAARLAGADAHVALAGGSSERRGAAAAGIVARHGERRAVDLGTYPADADAAETLVSSAVLAYGGFDALVDVLPPGSDPQRLSRAAQAILSDQGRGGAIVLVDATRGADELRALVAALAAQVRGVAPSALACRGLEARRHLASALVFLVTQAGAAWGGNVLVIGGHAGQEAHA